MQHAACDPFMSRKKIHVDWELDFAKRQNFEILEFFDFYILWQNSDQKIRYLCLIRKIFVMRIIIVCYRR